MANLWQTFANERIRAVKKRGSEEVEKKIMDYITQDGKKEPKAGQQEIPKELQMEILAMTKRHRDELEPMVATITLPYQQMIQSTTRKQRMTIIKNLMEEETSRLNAKAALRAIFSTS